MATIKLNLNHDQLINVINFCDQRGIHLEIKKESELFIELIDNKKFEEISFFIDRGTPIIEFIEKCNDDNIQMIKFLMEQYVNNGNEMMELLIDIIKTQKYIHIETLLSFYSDNSNDIKELINSMDGILLITAVQSGDKRMTKFLHKHGAKINKCKYDPIIEAVTNNHLSLVNFLIKIGSKLESILPEHFEICINKRYTPAINYIIEKIYSGELSYFLQMDLSKSLEIAAERNYLTVISFLMENGIKLNNDLFDRMYLWAKNNNNNNIIHYLDILNKKYCYKKPKKKINKNHLIKTRGGVDFND